MFGLGLWDDFCPLGAKRKLAGQLLIASAAYFLGIGIHKFQMPFLHQIIDLGLWSWPVSVVLSHFQCVSLLAWGVGAGFVSNGQCETFAKLQTVMVAVGRPPHFPMKL